MLPLIFWFLPNLESVGDQIPEEGDTNCKNLY